MKTLFVLIVSILVASSDAFLGNDVFTLGDSRLLDTFCAADADELRQIGSSTATMDSITRAGIKLSLMEYFIEVGCETGAFTKPPPGSNDTLVEIFQICYGECASTDRFLLAVQTIIDAASQQDNTPGIKEDPAEHFDAEALSQG